MSIPSTSSPDSQSPLPSPPGKRRSPPLFSLGFIALLSFAAMLGMVCGALYSSRFFHKYGHSLIAPPSVGSAFPGVNAVNLMIIGRDEDYNDQDQIIKTHARSDLLMMARIDFAAKNVRLLSIPRDTLAAIPGHGVTKINAAHAFGGPNCRPKPSSATLTSRPITMRRWISPVSNALSIFLAALT